MKITNKVFNLTSSFEKVKSQDDGSVVIRGMASTPDIDRSGDIIDPNAWNKGGLIDFKANPVILFNHNYDRPIGKATGVTVSDNGLEIEVKISKAAGDVCDLIKDGILGAFSVGFRVKDADYIEETNGLLIKDAELFEVSVVSVPCNQAATFSLAKSFSSEKEYEDYKKTFTHSVDLAGQSLAKEEAIASSIASDAPDGEAQASHQEKTMDPKDLEALMKKVADETATKIALQAAEKKAADEAQAKATADAEAAKQAQDEETRKAVEVSVITGTEQLAKDFEQKLSAKDADMAATIESFRKELDEKAAELASIQESKMRFNDRGNNGEGIVKFADEFVQAHILGIITDKGFETDFAKSLMEKAGVDYTTSAADIDQTVANRIEKEIMQELRVAGLFREIPVIAGATVLPMQPDSNPATFQTTGDTSGNLEEYGAVDAAFDVQQVILNAYRLISSTYIDNDTDEQILIALLPMLVDAVARAHARAVDSMIINGAGSIDGLDTYASVTDSTLSIGGGALLTAAGLLNARQVMGKYGMNPRDIAYVVSQNGYYDLLDDAGFQDINEVGSDIAMKVNGTVGAVYGSQVVVSDSFPAEAAGTPAGFAVNIRNYVIPRLRGIKLETDYEVMAQRSVIVGSQALGFEELTAGVAGHDGCIKIDFAA